MQWVEVGGGGVVGECLGVVVGAETTFMAVVFYSPHTDIVTAPLSGGRKRFTNSRLPVTHTDNPTWHSPVSKKQRQLFIHL